MRACFMTSVGYIEKFLLIKFGLDCGCTWTNFDDVQALPAYGTVDQRRHGYLSVRW